MHRFTDLVLRHRVAVLLACALLTLVALASLSRVIIASSIGAQFLGDRPEYHDYITRSARFGSDEIVLIGLDGVDPLADPEGLQALTEELEGLPDVARVHSPLSAQHISGEQGALTIGAYADLDDPDAARRGLLDDPFAAGLLISDDGRSTGIVVELTADPDRPAESIPTLVEAILDAARARYPDVRRGGFLAVVAATLEQLFTNVFVLTPIVAGVLLVVVWLMFRRLWPALLSLAVAALAMVWSIGFMVAIDPHLHTLTSLAMPVILIVAFSDVVHLCSAWLLAFEETDDPHAAITSATAEVGKACLLTSATTFVGFASLSLIPNPASRILGLGLGFGVAVALLLAITVVPALLSFIGRPQPLRAGPTAAVHAVMERALVAMGDLAWRRPWPIIAAFGALMIAALWGSAQVTLEADFADRFRESHPVRADREWFAERFAGTTPLEIHIDAPDGADLLEPERFAAMAATHDALLEIPGVGGGTSLVDLVRSLDDALDGDDALPDNRPALAQYLLLFEMSGGESLDRLIDFERRHARIALRLKVEGARATADIGRRAMEVARAHLPEDTTVTVTGLVFLLGFFFDDLMAGQTNSLLLSVGVIAVMMGVGLRSMRVGVVSMVPNLLPLLVMWGAAGVWFDKVDTDSIIIAVMAIGIGVDDTIHFLMRLRIELQKGRTPREAVTETFRTAGRGILMTTVILVAGFLPCAASGYLMMQLMGTLLPLALVVALAADLLLVPALVRVGALRMTP